MARRRQINTDGVTAMCGMLCCVRTSGELDRERFDAALESIRHRGPDWCGTMATGDVYLGHQRLKIIDLSNRANQPMSTPDGRYTILFNGEIYNFRELRRELESRGRRFETTGDAEVLLALYAEHGEDCLAKLSGMFAFIAWDWHKRELFAARDRMGIKPLYYTAGGWGIGLASEIRALLAAGLAGRDLNELAVEQYLSGGSVEAPQTIIRDVFALRPGHRLKWRDGRLDIAPWWRPPFVPEADKVELGEAEAKERLAELLENAVRSQLISDVPLGVFLSGGIDSSTIVAFMSRLGVGRMKTFSIGFDVGREAFDETHHARTVAQRYGTEHNEMILGGEEVVAVLPRYIHHLDQPSIDGLNTYFVSQYARQQITVCLSGMGGDELFAGYHTVRWLNRLSGSPLPRPQAANGWRHVYERLPLDWQRSKLVRGGFGMLGAWPTPLERYRMVRTLFTDRELAAIMTESCNGRRARLDEYYRYTHESGEPLSPTDEACRLDMMIYLANTLLRDTDVMSMAHALEIRVPFLDEQLLEYAIGLPSGLKFRDGRGKHLLIEVIKDLVPHDVIYRRKMGFSFPICLWMARRPLRDVMEDCLSQDGLAGRDIFRRDRLGRFIEHQRRGFERNPNSYYGVKLWLLTILELWMRETIDAASAAGTTDLSHAEAPAA
ncbi:asparagine synthase (glutamine-hydrolyzing) [bacterium]|nr:asparagine synthase (glutamine-hydrolyzing) [bacterium]